MKKKILLICIIGFFICFFAMGNSGIAKAETLNESIEEQLQNLDLEELSSYINNLNGEVDFYSLLDNLLNGEYNFSYNDFFSHLINIFLSNVKELLPIFLSVITIAVLCGIVSNLRGKYLSESISETIFFVCFLVIVLILTTNFFSLFNKVKIVIENLSNLSTIMSPIILTLMIASGGAVSASIYKPAVVFLTSGIISLVLNVILPIIGLITVFTVISNFSNNVKIKKFSEFFSSVLKWIIGIVITIYGLFITVQGITSASYDGISAKAAKYAISNSIPLIGGFLRDGFDLVVAGSILIKNSIGVIIVFSIFYVVLSPVLFLTAVSLLLKLTAAITEPISDIRISDFCGSVSKSISYLITALLMVGFMIFITVLLMIFSANAFI